MSIATSVRDHLAGQHVSYDTLTHVPTWDSMHSAQAAHIPGDRLAKGVLLEDDQGFLMAVIPATHRVDLDVVNRLLGRNLRLATDHELSAIFRDCEPGAMPPLPTAYGIDAVLDESLLALPEVYFEAGDHQALVHLQGSEFMKLMQSVPRALISYRT